MIAINIEKIKKLQVLSYKIYLNVIRRIIKGMSEVEIASIILNEFKNNGIDNFWYDIPIMVLIGENRFLDMTGDYNLKSPKLNHLLKVGDTINVDFTPMDKESFWGDFSATCVYHPKTEYDFKKVEFLKLIRKIQRDGIKIIASTDSGKDIATWYLEKFKENEITLVDVRNNFGHSMHQGSKKYPDGREKRIFMDINNMNPISENILAIEPSGLSKISPENKILVGKFEDCVYIPIAGEPLLLIPDEELPYSI